MTFVRIMAIGGDRSGFIERRRRGKYFVFLGGGKIDGLKGRGKKITKAWDPSPAPQKSKNSSGVISRHAGNSAEVRQREKKRAPKNIRENILF